MKNDKDMLIYGIIIGAIVGGCGFYLLKSSKKEKKLFFEKAGKILAEIGDMLLTSGEKDPLDEIVKKIPKKGNLADIAMLASIAINVLNKWR